MKVAIIPSLPTLEYDTGEFHMMLPEPYLRESRYRNYYNDVLGYKILDNGEAEGMRMQPRQLMDMAVQLGANEVIVPDHLGDCDKTIALAKNFAVHANRYSGINFMGVLQGRSYAEYLKCFTEMRKLPYITVFGIPRNIVKTVGNKWARVALAEMLANEYDYSYRAYHALGATPWKREAAVLGEIPIMRSIDTSLPVVMGIEGLDIRTDDYIVRQDDFFVRDLDHLQREMILDNIAAYRDWAGDYPDHAKTPVGQV